MLQILIVVAVIGIIFIIATLQEFKNGEVPFGFPGKYTEIALLKLMLKREKINHHINRAFDGWQIIVPLKDGELSIVEHAHSYGSAMDLLEIMDDCGNVKGFLTAVQALADIEEKLRKEEECSQRKEK